MAISEQIKALQTDKENIATAIEDMGGTVNSGDGYDDFANDIRTISTGLETIESDYVKVKKREYYVVFRGLYDEIERWSLEEALTKTALPDNPALETDSGLTPNGWNWTLQDIKDYINNQNVASDIFVGAQYKVNDGNVHLFISIPYGGRLTVQLYAKSSVASGHTIDWGDSSTTVMSTTSLTTYSHTYAKSGDYEIIFKRSSGYLQMSGSSAYNVFGSLTQSASSPVYARSSILTKVYLNSYLTTCNYAFKQCGRLETVVFDSSCTVNYSYMFHSAYNVSNVSIPYGVTTMSEGVFCLCYCLKYLCLPSTTKTISYNTCNGCYSLRQVSFPASVTTIGSVSFTSCNALYAVTIPKNLAVSAYVAAFYSTRNLQQMFLKDKYDIEVTFDDNYKYFDGTYLNATHVNMNTSAYPNYNCCSMMALRDVTLQDSYTTTGATGYFLYLGCVSLDCDGLVPYGMTDVRDNMFQYCTSLSHIEFPSTVTRLKTWVNHGNNSLKTVVFDKPYNITETQTGCFQANYSMHEFEIPNTIKTLGAQFMHTCYSVKSIEVPSSVTSASSMLFYQCYSLQYVKWSTNVAIPSNAFYQCYGVKTYDFSDCTAVPTLSSTSWLQVNSDTVIVVPDSLYSTWIAASGWSTYSSYIKKASEVTLA